MVEVKGITVEWGLPDSWGVAAATVDVPSRRSRAIGSSSRVEKDFIMVDSIVCDEIFLDLFFCRMSGVGDGGEAAQERQDKRRVRVPTHTLQRGRACSFPQ